MEEKPINLSLTIAAALRQSPVQWVNAAAALHQVEPERRRPERERSVAAALKDAKALRRRLDAEDPQLKAILQQIMQSGGWCKLAALTRRFGAMSGDGFFWDEQPPVSPIGRLRALSLVYVGRSHVDGKNHKVAVIPADLRATLLDLL